MDKEEIKLMLKETFKPTNEDLIQLMIIFVILMDCHNFDEVKLTLNKFKDKGLLSEHNHDKFMRIFEELKEKKANEEVWVTTTDDEKMTIDEFLKKGN